MSGVARRLWATAATWVAVLSVVVVAVHPERCPTATAAEARRSAELAVRWFAANLLDDGRFVYRYNRDADGTEPGYNEPRHAGVLLALYQAEVAGVEGAASAAEPALRFVDDSLVDTPVGIAFGGGEALSTGSSALLAGALVERRIGLGRTDRDDLLRELGHTLQATVTADGAVDAMIDRESGPVPGTRSPFFTGEVMWALSRLEVVFPGEGFGSTALTIRRYLVEDRDEVERPFPHVSDHWGAYAWEVMGRWPSPPMIGPAEWAWLDRQLGLFGLQVRYESQRVGGITTLTRGTHALAAGVGTLGEGIGNYLLVDDRDPFLRADERADLIERARCTAGLLVDRQIKPDEARAEPDPAAVSGAWFRRGVTQMDDQQHALSALLLLENRLEG